MKKELSPLILFISALIVFGTLSVLGIIYNLGKSIFECCKLNFITGIFMFVGYWLRMLYQVWNVVKYFLMRAAVAVDMFGNVAGGELVEDCVTAREDTLYGDGNVTVSAATGKLEQDEELNKVGKFFTKLLSVTLGENHSVNAYKKYQKENE
jgi:hypothetical protein